MNKNTVLLVDDEPELLEICKESMEEVGHQVLLASNGVQALNILNTEDVHLVVSDLRMPGLNGMELLQKINTSGHEVDVIILTGYGTVENAVECLKMGAADYLLKPFNITDLLAKVTKVLMERKLREEQKKVSDLLKMLNLSDTLNRQQDLRSMIREFAIQVKNTFSPDGISLFISGGKTARLKSNFKWGPLLDNNPRICKFLRIVSDHLLSQGRAKLLDPVAIKRTAGTVKNVPHELLEVSVMLVPMICGQKKTGIIAVLRSEEKPQYSIRDLNLLTIFASHAASSFENLKAFRRIQGMNLEIITSYVRAVEAKDIYTRGHSERVSNYAVILGRELGLSEQELKHLSIAGLLHDIGKIGVPDNILNKPNKLTPEEIAIMRRHPVVGHEIVGRITSLKDILPVIYHHHEWVDGSGYPDGLKGDEVPFLARLVSVVDGFEAITSDRAYHKAISFTDAEKIITRGAGVQWDEDMVDVWLRTINEKDLTGEIPTPGFFGELATAGGL